MIAANGFRLDMLVMPLLMLSFFALQLDRANMYVSSIFFPFRDTSKILDTVAMP
jgi:ABC-type polysaccharide/polyol phosphate export permease